ncbi:FAD-dependent monooxygenase [Cognatishimia sp.]|uniref:FAD-dependent monooxygenase n=1 Tax=Cognatishimia sp. TaxID=2211648 RepID=UPI003512EA70
MSLIGLNICVVGGGIGGLTAAIALARRGASVEVLEQAPVISEVGAGIQVSPNGMCVLAALGVADDIQARSVQAEAVELRDYRASRLVTRLNLGLLDATQKYFFLHRADLIDSLTQGAKAAGVTVHVGQKAVAVQAGHPASVTLENGDKRTADLVVCADGLHSIGRGALNGTLAPYFTRQVAWRAIVPNTIDHPNVARVHMGPKRHVVTYPLRDGSGVNLVAVEEKGAWGEESWATQDDPANMLAAFEDFCDPVKHLMRGAQAVGKWGLFKHPVALKWSDQGVVLLGDAAHPTLPFMAQGAVMAIEDAWVLAASLDRTDDLAAGLAAYQERRFERVSKIVETASKNAWRYHLSFPPLRFAAHSVMRFGGAVAPSKMMGQFDWIYRHDVTAD